MTGKVYLVGVGPGSGDLVSLRGISLLEMADAVLYDCLISRQILCQTRRDAVLIPAGKRAGAHGVSQSEINRMLVEMAGRYGCIVRLKGGDPFVFGRGGEEIICLREHGIPFEVVPGITSAIAVLSSAGIPVTHRKLARSFHVITGSTADDSEIRDLPLYARMEGTLVFMMAHRRIRELSEKLMGYGRDPCTPCAVVSSGTYITERRITATLGTIGAVMHETGGVVPPSVFVVGKTAALDFRCDYDSLSGCRVGVTGSASFTSKMARLLKNSGARVISLPDLCISPVRLSEQDISLILQHQWLVFTSANGVAVFFEELAASRTDIRSLSRCRIAAVGSGTERELGKHGIFADLVPGEYSVAALGRALRDFIIAGSEGNTSGVRVALLRSSMGSRCIDECLGKAGITCSDYQIYRPLRQDRSDSQGEDENLMPVFNSGTAAMYPVQSISDKSYPEYHPELDYLVFGSASGVRNFIPSMSAIKIIRALVAIGTVTSEEIRKSFGGIKEFGALPVLVAESFSASGILKTLKDNWWRHGSRPADTDLGEKNA